MMDGAQREATLARVEKTRRVSNGQPRVRRSDARRGCVRFAVLFAVRCPPGRSDATRQRGLAGVVSSPPQCAWCVPSPAAPLIVSPEPAGQLASGSAARARCGPPRCAVRRDATTEQRRPGGGSEERRARRDSSGTGQFLWNQRRAIDGPADRTAPHPRPAVSPCRRLNEVES